MYPDNLTKEQIEKQIKRLTEEKAFIDEQYRMMQGYENAALKKVEVSTGILLGLAIGIVGNVFVQFLYSFLESVTNANLTFLYVSIVGLVVSSVILFLVVRHYRKTIKYEKTYVDDNLASGKSALRVRYANIGFEVEELNQKIEKKKLSDGKT